MWRFCPSAARSNVQGKAIRRPLYPRQLCPLRISPCLVGLLTLFLFWSAVPLVSTSSLTAQAIPSQNSSTILALTPDGGTLLVVNPDSNSLTLVDTTGLQVLVEIVVGIDPRSVAVSADGTRAYVANQGSDSLSVVDLAARQVIAQVATGDRPVGAAISPNGLWVAVAELGDDQVRLLDAATAATLAVVPVADRPHGLAFTPDSRRLLVTHLLCGDVTVLALQPFVAYLPLVLKGQSPRASSVPANMRQVSPSPGNLVCSTTTISTWPQVAPAAAVLVNASGTRAYLPQTMANGLGLNTQFDTTVFPKISVLNLETGQHQTSEHISLPEKDQPVGLPWAVALTRADGELWVVNAASNDVSVLDISDPTRVSRVAHIPVGDNPRGIVIHPSGETAYVSDTLAGTVSVIDTATHAVKAVIAVTQIPLPPVLLQGKRLFHSSARSDLAQARWIACNTCHIEGEHDGRTWLLQYTGQVPPGATAVITRNTTSLLGMIETYPLRWSAEWDESADSEFSIRFEQFGTGLIQGGMNPTLGPPNQGRSWDLDCLASYIDSLGVPARSHELSPAEQRGLELFLSPRTGCSLCHPAPLYTDQRQHDVGTASADGEWFGPRMDTPTLRFLYDSAPYLHDGSAATLYDVLTTANAEDKHGTTAGLTPQELDDLVAFMLALPYPPEAEPFTYQASSCLGEPTRGPDQIDIWAEGHDIYMAHQDAVYNCCAQLVVYLEDSRPLLKLIEQEAYPDGSPCRCECTYQLGAHISSLPAGTYQVQVWNGAVGILLEEKEVTVE